MSSKHIFINEEYLLDKNGSPIEMLQRQGKCYAVILKCGHCGNGYFIPLIVCERAQNIHSAITLAKRMPRVKRDKRDAVIDAFEITYFEKFFIEKINDRDGYRLGKVLEDDQETLERRILEKRVSDNPEHYEHEYRSTPVQKTSAQYEEKYALERFCAPIKQGTKYIYPSHINKQELLNEIFKQSAFEYGIKEDDELFISLYYQYFGEPNELGIVFDGENFSYEGIDGEEKCVKVTACYGKINKKSHENEERESDSWGDVHIQIAGRDKIDKRPSRIERFNARIEKYKQITDPQSELGK